MSLDEKKGRSARNWSEVWCSGMREKNYTLRWFGHMKRKKSKKFVKKVYVSGTEDPRRRGKPVVRWKNRIKDYMHERVC